MYRTTWQSSWFNGGYEIPHCETKAEIMMDGGVAIGLCLFAWDLGFGIWAVCGNFGYLRESSKKVWTENELTA